MDTNSRSVYILGRYAMRTRRIETALPLPVRRARLSNLSRWEVRNTFILFTAVVVRCCSIALHMPQYREFSIASKTEPAR